MNQSTTILCSSSVLLKLLEARGPKPEYEIYITGCEMRIEGANEILEVERENQRSFIGHYTSWSFQSLVRLLKNIPEQPISITLDNNIVVSQILL